MAGVRRVRRIVRKIDPWTVLKVSFVLYAVVALAMVLGVVILWAVANNVGIPQGLDDVAVRLTLVDEGDTIFGDTDRWFLIAVFLGVVWTVLMTGLTTLAAVMYNLVSDIVGGVEVVVLEETYNVPQAPVRSPQQWQRTATAPAVNQDIVELPTAETEPVRATDAESPTPDTDTEADQSSDEYDATVSPEPTATSTKAAGASKA
ncbi:MAG: DUF3566 domain-containing protein [Acidimicrobiia bacterium]